MDTLQELHERERAELACRHEAEREAAGLDPTPRATWNAFSPEELAKVITGVTRSHPGLGQEVVHELTLRAAAESGAAAYEFTTERRDPFGGALIGGARWLAEHDPGIYASWRLHLLLSEPEGVA